MNAFEQKRCQNMAEEIAQKVFINEELFNAFCQIPREIFSPLKAHAYRLDALPLANSQWISSPLTVAKMTMALDFKNADSILEIGCGSGYQAAILSKVIRRVFTIERIENLAKKAAQTFRELELFNINVKFDDREAMYSVENVGELELAYAMTVHKSQGSEFDGVIIPVVATPQKLAYRNLFYTAVTRAKKLIVLVGTESNVRAMVENDKKSRRYSALLHFLTVDNNPFLQ